MTTATIRFDITPDVTGVLVMDDDGLWNAYVDNILVLEGGVSNPQADIVEAFRDLYVAMCSKQGEIIDRRKNA